MRCAGWYKMPARVVAAVAMLLTAAGCGDERAIESPVPAGRVNYECYVASINEQMQQTDGKSLEVMGGYVHIDQWRQQGYYIGIHGLLLCHDNFSDAIYYAYDLACPYCYPKAHTIRLTDGLTARCGECKSEFGAVLWGSPAPTAGPANEKGLPLRSYRARLNTASGRLMVTN